MICIVVVFNFGFSQASFGFAINAMILNPLILVMILAKYRRYLKLLAQYRPVQVQRCDAAV